MIHATYITHDFGVQYKLIGPSDDCPSWVVYTLLAENDFELYPGGVEWLNDEWHARARFERLVADDITALQEKEASNAH